MQEGISLTDYHDAEIERANAILKELNLDFTLHKG